MSNMPNFREQYKEKPFGFGGANEGRLIRAERREVTRKSQRSKAFNENRQILDSTQNTPQRPGTSSEESVAREDRATRLQKWKVEKERQRKKHQLKKKKPFVVGVVHHKIYSPISKDDSVIVVPNKTYVKTESVPNNSRKISKATEKRLKAKTMQAKVKPTMKVTRPPKEKKSQKLEESLAPVNYEFKVPIGLHEIPLFGRSIITNIDKHIKSFVFSPPSRRSKRASRAGFIVEDVYSKENRGPTSSESLSDENAMTKEDSVEAITLRLSSDGHETLNSSSENEVQKSMNTSLESQAEHVKTRRSSSKDFNLNTSLGLTKGQSPNVSLNSLRREVLNSSIEKMNLSLNNSKVAHLNSSSENITEGALNTSISTKANGILSSSVTEKTPQSNTEHASVNGGSCDSRKSNSSSDPAMFSPYIVTSRGKSKARKEQQLRRGLGRSPTAGIPTKDTVMHSLNISIEDEERTAQYFHFLLKKEAERLEELCRQWEEIKTEPGVTEDAQYQINQAIGQTNLLLTKKFERFRSLVCDCETGKGEMLVTCKDLQGFWDMMYREVTDCDARFQKLEKSRSENWVEEQQVIIKPVVKKKAAAKKKVVSSKPSSIRALIMAARKEKKASDARSNSDSSDTYQSDNNSTTNSTVSNRSNSPAVKVYSRKSISSGANQTQRTSVKRQSTGMSLLQKVQLSETSKKIRSPLTLMKISKMCKTPDPKIEESMSFVNSEQTPGKSILKKSTSIKDSDSSMRLTHKVNFNDTVVLNEVPVDEETQTKLDLAAALERIDCFDFDTSRENLEQAVGRRLSFDDDSSDESPDILDEFEKREEEIEKQHSFERKNTLRVPFLTIEGATPSKEEEDTRLDEKSPSAASVTFENSNMSPLRNKESPNNRNRRRSSGRKKLRRQNAVEEDSDTEEHNESIRVLRNRTISAKDMPVAPRTPRRRAASMIMQTTEQKENRTPSRRGRKSLLKTRITGEDHSTIGLEGAMDSISLDKPKRKSRLSVKYSENDCTGCIETKPSFPVTPHVRRSRLQSSEIKKRSTFSADLISFDSPVKPPERIRRSQSKKM